MIKINRNSISLIKTEMKKGECYMLSILEGKNAIGIDNHAPYFSIVLGFKTINNREVMIRERYDSFGVCGAENSEFNIENIATDEADTFSYYLLNKEEASPYLKNLIVLSLEKNNLEAK